MSRRWFSRFLRPNRIHRTIRRSRPLGHETLESRVVPATTITFQQGTVPLGAFSPYAGTSQIRIDNQSPLTNIDGTLDPTGFYFLDGTFTNDLGSANQWDLLRFDDIFGSGPGQIPVGAIIRSATLQYSTATTTENASAPSAGPFGVVQLLSPFDKTTTWASLGNNVQGPALGVQTDWPITSSFRTPSVPAGFDLKSDPTVALPAVADITSIVQNWSLGSANNGVMVRQLGSSDGWAVRTVSSPEVASRPSLSITFDPPPTSSKVATFQEGVDGYSGAVSAWIQQSGVTADGATLSTPVFLDGNLPTDIGSPDDQMLIRFNNLFGGAPGQIPVGSSIQSARLVLTTGGLEDSTNAKSAGAWAASQVLVNWDTTTKYTDPVFGKNGPSLPTSKTTSVAAPGDATSELKALSNAISPSFDARAWFDVTAAVQSWLANPSSNFGLNVQASGTSDGWQVHFPGSTNFSARPRLEVIYTPPALVEPATTTVDLVDGALRVVGGAGVANNLTVSLAAGVYTLSDPAGPVTLAPAAITAGWSVVNANTVSGPTGSLTRLIIATGAANDTVTISGLDKPLSLDGGGQAGDTLAVTGALSTGNGDFTVLGVGTVTATAGSLINTGTGPVNLTAANAIGTVANPVLTSAGRLNLRAGSGGAFVTESDGADLVADVTGTGALAVTNAAGTLTVPLNEVVRTAQGPITLASAGALTVNGLLGVSAKTGAGLISLAANTGGSTVTTNAFTQGTRANIGTSGDVSITVNTAAAGTAAAVLGTGGIGGTITVRGNGGAINWNSGFAIPADTAATNLFTLAARHYSLSSSSSIGTSAAPIQTNNGGTADGTPGDSTANLAGAKGVFLTDWGPIDLTVVNATALTSGAVNIRAANAATHKLYVAGNVTSATGAITLQADDDLILEAAAKVGGATSSGAISLIANNDRGGESRFVMAPGASVQNTNTSASAVSILVYGTDGDATTPDIGGATVGAITTGNGGTVAVNVNPLATATNTGNIQQVPGTLINTGATGKVLLTARALINAGAPAAGAGIGTALEPILTKAGTVTATSVNGPVYVLESDGASVTVVTQGLGDTAATINVPTPVSGLEAFVKTTTGALTVAGASNTDGAPLSLIANGTGGQIIVSATLNDADTGAIALDAGAGTITFNNAFATNAGQTVTFTSGPAAKFLASVVNDGTIVAASGVEVGAGATLSGTGGVTGPVTVTNTGILRPAGFFTSIYGTGNLTLQSGGILDINVNGSTPGTELDQIKTTGTVNVTGASLRLIVGAGVTIGQSFTVVDNDGADPVVGTFVSGATINAFNTPLVTFSINYAGGDGNDIVVTVSAISPASAVLDVQGADVIYFSNVGINNNVTWSLSGSTYTVNEAAGNITLTPAAITAGWTGGGSKTVTGPSAGINGISISVNDGSDTISGIQAGSASIALSGLGAAIISGAVTTTKNIAVTEFNALTANAPVTAGTGITVTGEQTLPISGGSTIGTTAGNIDVTRTGSLSVTGVNLAAGAGTINLNGNAASTTTLNAFTATANLLKANGAGTVSVAGVVTANTAVTITGGANILAAGGKIVAPTVSLTASNAIGGIGAPILTQAGTITASGGTGGVYVTEADGASFTASATVDGSVELTNNQGTLIVAGAIAAANGNITIVSADGVEVNANVGSTALKGTIAIKANTDGAGSQGFLQSATAVIKTANTSSTALALTVNTPLGGTGNAVLGQATIGTTAGGTVEVAANGGSILWNPDLTIGNPVGGSNALTLAANEYIFSTKGSVGTQDRPIQTNVLATNNKFGAGRASVTAGAGGVFWADWNDADLTFTSVFAEAGDIELYSANAGGSNLYIDGQIYTGNGNILLSGDDDLFIGDPTNTTGGIGIVGGTGPQGDFKGTITLAANRDGGNEQRIVFSNTASVITTNTTADAVLMFVTATDNNAANATLGGVLVGTVKVGNGGTVTIDAAQGVGKHGSIRQILGTRIDAGANGTVVLKAQNLVTGSPAQPAVGAGIRFDLDGSGINVGPLQVLAKTVQIFAVNTPVDVAEGDGSFFNDADGLEASASLVGPGTLRLATSGGILTIVAPTNTDGGALTLSSFGLGGGIVVNAPLGDSNTGAMTIDAGTNNVVINDTLLVPAGTAATIIDGNVAQLGPVTEVQAGATLTAVNGVELGSGDKLTGTGTVVGAVNALSGGIVSPGVGGPGTLGTGALTLAAGGVLAAEVFGKSAGSFDQVVVTGTVNVTGAKLQITSSLTLAVGDSVVLVANDGADPVVGTFAGGPNISAVNDPRFVFTVNYAGGDGNDIVVTLTSILSTVFEVTAGKGQYSTSLGINNNVTVSLAAGVYTITDPATPITLLAGALAAGWTNAGPNTVTGPAASLNALALALADGADQIGGLQAGVPTSVNFVGSVNLAGPANVTGDLTFSGTGTLAVAATATSTTRIATAGLAAVTATPGGKLAAPDLDLAATALGTATDPLATTATTIKAAAGSGGVFLTETDGADVTLTATGVGSIGVNNLAGTLTVAGPTTAVDGNILLSSKDGIAVNATIGDTVTFGGTITIEANTDGAGAEGYTQAATASLNTFNATADALKITVNTAGGGTGNAVLGLGVIGGNSGGTASVQAFGGSILWGASLDTATVNQPEGGSNTNTFKARNYVFNTTGAGSIGTADAPIQTDNFNSADGQSTVTPNTPAGLSTMLLAAGTGGIFVSDWGGLDMVVAGATAAGGDIVLRAANAGGHNQFVTGNIFTASGNILLAADDDLFVGPGVTIGGAGFAGAVTILGSRDKVNEQRVTLDATTAIVTSNATANAVLITNRATDTAPGNTTIGGVTLSNITVGDGGTITINAADGAPNHGNIVQQPGTTLNAGPAGTVVLTTQSALNGSAPAAASGIGTATQPISVAAGTVVVGNLNSDSFVTAAAAAKFTATTTGPGAQTLAVATGTLTIAGATNTDGGAVSLTGPGGVALNATLGDGNTGAITVNGALSGSGAIVLGSGALNVIQATDSTFDGAISGSKAVEKNGAGALTLSGTSGYTGATIVTAGTLLLTGSLTGTSSVDVAATGTFGGTGTAVRPVNVAGTVAPGVAGPGILSVGNTVFSTGSTYAVNLNGATPGSGHDQLAVTGTVNLGGAALAATIGGGFNPSVGTAVTIVNNDSSDPVTGTFAGLPEGASVTAGGQVYTISYVGGDGNDVTLTRAAALASKVTGVVINNGAAQRSRVTSLKVNFDNPVTVANPASAFTLTRVSDSASVTLNTVFDPSGLFATITFTGGAVDGANAVRSLADGRYTLTAVASAFGGGGLDGDGNGTAGDNFVFASTPFVNVGTPATGIFRLFGDNNGNGQIATDDFLAFRLNFLSNNDAFDNDGNGTVDAGDFLKFRLNFLAAIA